MFLEQEKKRKYSSLREEFVSGLKERFEKEEIKSGVKRKIFLDNGSKNSKDGFSGN